MKNIILITREELREIIEISIEKVLNKVPHVEKEESSNFGSEEIVKKFGDREGYMSITECAKFLSCSKVTIHEYKKQGLPFLRIGRTVMFLKSEVVNFMRKGSRKNVKWKTGRK